MQDDRLTRAAFLRQLAFLAAGAAVPALLGDDAARAEDTPAQAPAPAGGTVDFALQVDVAKRGERLGARFLGLSYEAVALAGGGRNRPPWYGRCACPEALRRPRDPLRAAPAPKRRRQPGSWVR